MIVLCSQEMTLYFLLIEKLLARKVELLKLRSPYHKRIQFSFSDDPLLK